MAIMPYLLGRYYSLGTTGSTAPQTDPDASLGGTIAVTGVSPNARGVFSDITLVQSTAGRVRYRCVYIVNEHPTLTWTDVRAYVDGSDALDVSLDAAAVGANSTTTIADETIAPAGRVFAGTAVDYGTGLRIGDLIPGAKKAIWLKNTTLAGAPNTVGIWDVQIVGMTEV